MYNAHAGGNSGCGSSLKIGTCTALPLRVTPTCCTAWVMESSYGHRGVFYQSCAMASNDMYLIFGYVGIGTTAPTSLLHTNDTAAKTASYFGV
ncbi:MAG: hypothetical protein NTY08_18695 [Proteobacteria bacterium]|nr:hypothetical protein [Pseudomonadota bacterium]